MGLDNPLHIAFLVVILLLVFGARRLPEIGRSLGSGMREFKDSVTGGSQQPALTQGQQVQAPAPPQQPAEPAQQQPAPVQQQPASAQQQPVQPQQAAPAPAQPAPEQAAPPQQLPAEPTRQG
jgi:sec-independent protein translocase protein TatA